MAALHRSYLIYIKTVGCQLKWLLGAGGRSGQVAAGTGLTAFCLIILLCYGRTRFCMYLSSIDCILSFEVYCRVVCMVVVFGACLFDTTIRSVTPCCSACMLFVYCESRSMLES